ncbi:MAG: protein phosphatase 2C domain-containing protein [Pseudomonadota bacterium]
MDIISFGATDIGRKRTTNEDSYLVDDSLGLYVVADGMGGHAAGEVASSEAIDAIASLVTNERKLIEDFKKGGIDVDAGLGRLSRCLESAIQSAAYLVHSIAEIDEDKIGMGTTISALLIVGEHGLTGQVGDSRVYYVRKKQTVQLTEDHTLINWQLKEGLITPEQASVAKNRNVVTRAVGSKDYVQVDVQSFPVHPEDKFMLCSDGLYEYINDIEIAAVLDHDPEPAVRHLVELALNRGGKDNVTSIVVEIV